MDFESGLRQATGKDRVFPAIDVDTLDDAKRLMDELVGLVAYVKFGLQLVTRESWSAAVAAADERGFKVFCDGKFKDIPNTVENAAYSIAHQRPGFFTVMADTSREALRAARTGVDRAAAELSLNEKPKIIAVTVLTAISDDECRQIYGADAKAKVLQFGTNAVEAGLDAIVCSPEEINLFRPAEKFKDTIIITPGVRPTWAASNDQSRVATPAEAIKRGADMLVIGRPITRPPREIGSIKEAVRRITQEIDEVLA